MPDGFSLCVIKMKKGLLHFLVSSSSFPPTLKNILNITHIEVLYNARKK